MIRGADGEAEGLLRSLVERAKDAPAEHVGELAADTVIALGGRNVVIYVVDREQLHLVPVPIPGQPAGAPLTIDGTLGGRAFRDVTVLSNPVGDGTRIWFPVLDGVERIGLLEGVFDDPTALTLERCRWIASVLGELIVAKSQYSDLFVNLRRSRVPTLAAEIQSGVLPPLTCATPSLTISGVLQPFYEIGGDTFDYAVGESVAHFALFDAMGHGLPAAILASLTVASYRHSRRQGLGLLDTYRAAEDAIAGQYGPERFVTALMARLDLETGRLEWICAGHPVPLLVRNGSVLGPVPCKPTLPLGIGDGTAELAVTSLEPGDRLLLFTDGVEEARAADGTFFGQSRLSHLLERESMGGHPVPEMMRRLSHAILDYQDGELQDDATTLLVEWRRPSIGPVRG